MSELRKILVFHHTGLSDQAAAALEFPQGVSTTALAAVEDGRTPLKANRGVWICSGSQIKNPKRSPAAPFMRILADNAKSFPDPATATDDGLVAIGGDLSVPRLLLAYRSGIFPWTIGPITWWSPDPRAILELDQFHVSKSLAKLIRKGTFEITLDRAFKDVMEGCAAPAPGRRQTWISPEFIAAYTLLHKEGYAHSLECWQSGQLVGGIYGVSIGGFFAGESMFHTVSNASKIGLFHLVAHLRERGFTLFDIQTPTPTTCHLGALLIPRSDYLKRLGAAMALNRSF